MCGITGIYSPQNNQNREEFHAMGQAMSAAIPHRGPDSYGIWQDPDTALLLAHRRLAIMDLSPSGHQPMISASTRYTLSCNGEIYNYLALQKELTALGVRFKGRSDTEILLAAIDQWGLNQALQKINGMFAIALWDRKTQELHLIRDRIGKKPLYVGWSGHDFIFASELKAIQNHKEFQPKINRNNLNAYMRFGYMPAPLCIYEDLWMLPPAHRLTISADDLKTRPKLPTKMQAYWESSTIMSKARTNGQIKQDGQIISEFEDLLQTCIKDRMLSDVPLGAFLSGGIDSSTIVALMQKQSNKKIKTYSIGFHETRFDEANHAAKIATYLGTDHHELYIEAKDSLNLIPQLPNIYDEPFADISAIPTYFVSKFARKSVSVVLSGDGGDEMLGGYNRHTTAPQIWKRMRFMPAPMRKAMAKAIQLMPTSRLDTLMRRHPQFGTRLHKAASIFGLSSEEEIYMRLISQWDNADALVLNSHMPDIPVTQPFKMPEGLSFAEKMMYKDSISYLPNDVLTKIDRASMAVSLEARAPLLDTRIYEYVWGLHVDAKIRGGAGKWLLREVLARHIPRELFERPKQGFTVPAGEWLRGPLRDWAENLLNEQTLNQDGYLNAKLTRNIWENHLQGRGEHTGKIWNILMFQAWKERWINP